MAGEEYGTEEIRPDFAFLTSGNLAIQRTGVDKEKLAVDDRMENVKRRYETKKLENGTLTLGLTGRLDTVTAPQLEKVIQGEMDGIQKLILDLADLEYISSAGLRVLLTAQKIMSRKDGMEIRNPNELVMEVFEVTGFTDILDIRE